MKKNIKYERIMDTMSIENQSGFERFRTERSEVKSVVCIKGAMNRCSRQRVMKVNPCVGTSSTVKMCMAPAKHLRFIKRKTYGEFIHTLPMSVVKMFARNAPNKKADTSGSHEVKDFASMLVRAMDGTYTRGR